MPAKKPRKKNQVSKRKDPKRPKRSEIQRNRDLPIIANLYLQGHTQASISAAITEGKKYKLTVATISKDIKHIEALWLDSTLVDFSTAKAKELALLDYAEAELWQAWHGSKQPKLIRVKEGATRQTAPAGKTKKGKAIKAQTLAAGKTIERYEQRDPSPRYIDLILEIVDKRLRILGAFAPEAHVFGVVDLDDLDKQRAERWEQNKEVMLEALQLKDAIMIDVPAINAGSKKNKRNGSKNGKAK